MKKDILIQLYKRNNDGISVYEAKPNYQKIGEFKKEEMAKIPDDKKFCVIYCPSEAFDVPFSGIYSENYDRFTLLNPYKEIHYSHDSGNSEQTKTLDNFYQSNMLNDVVYQLVGNKSQENFYLAFSDVTSKNYYGGHCLNNIIAIPESLYQFYQFYYNLVKNNQIDESFDCSQYIKMFKISQDPVIEYSLRDIKTYFEMLYIKNISHYSNCDDFLAEIDKETQILKLKK